MINIFNALKKNRNKANASASMAKERLQIVIASNRRNSKLPFLKDLEEELLAVIKKYIEIKEGDMEVKVQEDEETGLEVLELNVNLPDGEEFNFKNQN